MEDFEQNVNERKETNNMEQMLKQKERDLKRYKEKFEKLQTDYKNYMLGKDKNGETKKPFYNPSGPEK